MPPLEVSEEEWICRFILPDEWDYEFQQPIPRAFKASDRQLSAFHTKQVEDAGFTLQDLCIHQLSGSGEAYLKVKDCIELGQGISPQFDPKVYWRPEKVAQSHQRWKDAHVQIESQGGNATFPKSYRSLLAENSICPRPPDRG